MVNKNAQFRKVKFSGNFRKSLHRDKKAKAFFLSLWFCIWIWEAQSCASDHFITLYFHCPFCSVGHVKYFYAILRVFGRYFIVSSLYVQYLIRLPFNFPQFPPFSSFLSLFVCNSRAIDRFIQLNTKALKCDYRREVASVDCGLSCMYAAHTYMEGPAGCECVCVFVAKQINRQQYNTHTHTFIQLKLTLRPE